MSHLQFTCSNGSGKGKGEWVEIEADDIVQGFLEWLNSRQVCENAWMSGAVFTDNARNLKAWVGVQVVNIDLDTIGHRLLQDHEKEAIANVNSIQRLPGNVFYFTPRGCRLSFVFKEPVIDKAVARRLHKAIDDRVTAALLDAELADVLEVDKPAAKDLAKFMWMPHTRVWRAKEQNWDHREAVAVVLHKAPHDAWSFLAEKAPMPAPLPKSKALLTPAEAAVVAEGEPVPQADNLVGDLASGVQEPHTLDANDSKVDGDLAAVQDALCYLHPQGRNDWFGVGCALHHEFGEDAFDLWDEWSARSESYGETRSKWDSMARGGGSTKPIEWVYTSAKAAGWTGTPPLPSALDAALDEAQRKTEAEKSAKVAGSPILTLAREPHPDWFDAEAPPQEFLLRHPDGEGFAPLGEAGTFAAAGGAGKTTSMVQLAISVATKRPWLNHWVIDPEAPRGVLMALAEEKADEVHRKIQRISKRLELTAGEQELVREHVTVIPLAGHVTPMLAMEGNVPADTVHLEAMRVLQRQMGQLGLVVLDPQSRLAGIEVEKDNNLATRWVQACESLSVPSCGRPLTLAVAHSSKAARDEGKVNSRGVTGLVDGFRFGMTLRGHRSSKQKAVLGNSKNNYGREADDVHLLRRAGGLLFVETIAEAAERVAAEAAEKAQEKEAEAVEQASKLDAAVEEVVATCKAEPGILKRELVAAISGTKDHRAGFIGEAIKRGRIEIRKATGTSGQAHYAK